MYHLASSAEYLSWHDWAKEQAGIPEGGKVNKSLSGLPAVDKQKTTKYSDCMQSEHGGDVHYFWYGDYPDDGTYLSDTTRYTYAQLVSAGHIVDGV